MSMIEQAIETDRTHRHGAPWRRGRRLAVVLAFFGIAGGLGGCGSIEPVPPQPDPITDPTQLYMGLTLDRPAVTLSTATGYDTLSLTATPRDALGNAMHGLPAATFTSSDTSKVTVTADGLLKVVGTGSGIQITAKLTVGGVTRSDVALVDVTNAAPPPVLSSFSIHPVPPDSAVWSALSFPLEGSFSGDIANFVDIILLQWPGFFDPTTYAGYTAVAGVGNVRLQARLADTGGSSLTGLFRVYYGSLDSAVATVDRQTGSVIISRPGQVRIVARTTVYGVDKADTATFTVTMPVIRAVSIYANQFFADEVRIAPYGFVAWTNYTTDPVDVTFDDPAHVTAPPDGPCAYWAFINPDICGSGNLVLPPIPVPPDDPNYNADNALYITVMRQFKQPGVYPYHNARTGASGRVVVTTDPNGKI